MTPIATPPMEMRVIIDMDLSFQGLLKYRFAMKASNPKSAPERDIKLYIITLLKLVFMLRQHDLLLSWLFRVKLFYEGVCAS